MRKASFTFCLKILSAHPQEPLIIVDMKWLHPARLRRYFALLLVVLSAAFSGCKAKKYTWSTEEEFYRLPMWQQRVNSFKKTKMEPNTAILFIGDSMTEGFDLQKFFPGIVAVNQGISGDFTSGVMRRLDVAVRLQPKKIFVMIGINDILKKVPFDQTLNNYNELLRQLRMQCPEAALYVQSNLPTAGMGGSTETNAAVVRQVRSLNDFLREQCKAVGATFIDMYKAYETGSGELNAIYTYDGLHLSDEGYAVWAQTIRSYVQNP